MNQGNKIKPFGVGRGLANLFSLSAHNVLVRACNAFLNLQVVEGETPSFVVSDNNAILTLRKNTAAAVAGGGAVFRAEIDDASDDDYLECTVQTGDLTGETINVLRPQTLRASISSETIDGNAISFTYSDSQTRTASATGFSPESHMIRTPYRVGDLIYVAEYDDDEFIDLNVDARKWQCIPEVPP